MKTYKQKYFPMLCVSAVLFLFTCISLLSSHTCSEHASMTQSQQQNHEHVPPANCGDTDRINTAVSNRAKAYVFAQPDHHNHHTSTRIIQAQESDQAQMVENEWQMRFRTAEELSAFLQSAALSPDITVMDSDYTLLAVRIREETRGAVDTLLRNSDTPPVEIGNNYWFGTPSPSPAPGSGFSPSVFAPVGAGGLAALGIDTSNAAWGRDVTVALVDSGIKDTILIDASRITSVDLLDEGRGNAEYPHIDSDDASEISKAMHGTIMASIIGSSNELLPGVAPEASFIDIRVLDDQARGDGFTIAKGIVTAVDMGADIINLSLAGMGDDMAVRAAVQYAVDNGVTLVAASGNDGLSQTAYPARYPGVIAVGATDAIGQHPEFSNTGREIDIAAPGYGVFAALGADTVVRTDGTSAAAAFVTGAIAGLMSQESLPAPAATGLVIAYADDTGEPGHDSAFGIGLVDLRRVKDRFEDYGDLATAGYFWHPFQPPEAGVPENAVLGVSVQNRGTVAVWNVMVEVTINGVPARYMLDSLEAGQSGSIDTGFTLQELQQTGQAVVMVTVWSPDIRDRYPENNSSTFYLSM